MYECSIAQSSLSLCDPVNCSPPSSPVHVVFQATILEWVANSYSRGSSLHRDQTHISSTGRCHPGSPYPLSSLPPSLSLSIYIYIHTHVYIHTCIYMYTSICIHVYIYIRTYKPSIFSLYIHTYIHKCMYIYKYSMYIYMYICTHTYMYIHIYIHTCMHIHICVCMYIVHTLFQNKKIYTNICPQLTTTCIAFEYLLSLE